MFKSNTQSLAKETLTLTELEVSTSFWLTWLLTFNSTAVTSQESMILQVLLIFSVYLNQCTCNSKTQCLALTSKATTIKVGLNVILTFNTEQLQWLLNHVLQDS